MEGLKKAWEDSEGLIVPNILLAKNKEGKKYYIINDKSTILYMISDNKKLTFCIPKKYCKNKGNYYLIEDYEKMIAISCSAKNKYEKLILNNI